MSDNIQFDFAALAETEIQRLIDENQLSITVAEALKIQEMVGRAPTLSECILWGIQGSEHCSYKSSRVHLKTLMTDGHNVILGAKEDAGVVEIARDRAGDAYGVVISHESHNHPSQVVPFEGAATGIGGNVRDVCCMGATVIANADSLRFGDIQQHKTHWVYEGVVAGIASYSNALGVPNIAGDVQFDAGYNENCLVTAVTLGVVKADHITHSYAPENADGYDLILVGKPTDNSGFGGASFASVDLEAEADEQNRGAVQEPNAFLGRMMLKSNYALFEKLAARNQVHRVGFKDLGAGGIACASVELAEAAGYGAEVCLDDVRVSMEHLNPAVLLCSETQERYMWVCPPELTAEVLAHYNEEYALPTVSQGARATVVGQIKQGGRYRVTYQGEVLIDAMAKDITQGIVYDRPVKSVARQLAAPTLPAADVLSTWRRVLAHENIASRACVYETYDKQVQGRTVLERGRADAGVLAPFNGPEWPSEIQQVGVALAVAANPRYGKIDPYWATINAVVQAVAQVVATGATPEAITDCLCFGNPEKPEQMADFVAAIDGMKTACQALTLFDHPDAALPIVAGNVSLYNESKSGAIPASPMISCLGRLADVEQAIGTDFQRADSQIILLGMPQAECGGSVYYQCHDALGAALPKPDLAKVRASLVWLQQQIQAGQILAAKSVALGGVLTAISLMSIAKGFGCSVTLATELTEIEALFSESFGFVLEVSAEDYAAVSSALESTGLPWQNLGHTTTDGVLSVNGHALPIAEAKQLWQDGLRQRLNA